MWISRTNSIVKAPPLIFRTILQQPHRCSSGASTSRGGTRIVKGILLTTGVVAVGTAGAVGYAWYDPEFRRSVESNVPQSKDVLDTIIGRSSEKPAISTPSFKEIGDKVSAVAASILPARKEQKNEVPVPSTAAASPSTPKPASVEKTVVKEKPVDKEKSPDEKTNAKKDPSEKMSKKTSEESEPSTKDFEDELRNQLRRQAAAHSEHLEDALKVQQTQLESKYRQQLNEMLQKQREEFNADVGSAIGKLKAIEAALEGRVEQDRENRRAKHLWIACQNLKRSLLQGRAEEDYASKKKPLSTELAAVKEAGTADPFVKALLTTVKPEALKDGVYTQDDLVNRFQKVKKVCRRTALIGDSGGTLFQYFVSLVQSWFVVDWVKLEPAQVLEVDPSNIDTIGILSRASYFVEQLQFTSAIKLLLLLKGEPARLASDWIKDAQLHLETRRAAELLLAHASALSIRTIY